MGLRGKGAAGQSNEDSIEPTGSSVEGHRMALPAERIERRILLIRGRHVMLDSDLADLYEGVNGSQTLFQRKR